MDEDDSTVDRREAIVGLTLIGSLSMLLASVVLARITMAPRKDAAATHDAIAQRFQEDGRSLKPDAARLAAENAEKRRPMVHDGQVKSADYVLTGEPEDEPLNAPTQP